MTIKVTLINLREAIRGLKKDNHARTAGDIENIAYACVNILENHIQKLEVEKK